VLNRQYHRELIYRALELDDNWKTQYAITRNRLLIEAKQDDVFSVYNRTTALLEFYLNLRPAILRRWIAKFLIFGADLKRFIRNKKVQ
jgi:hypothetical protein